MMTLYNFEEVEKIFSVTVFLVYVIVLSWLKTDLTKFLSGLEEMNIKVQGATSVVTNITSTVFINFISYMFRL